MQAGSVKQSRNKMNYALFLSSHKRNVSIY